MKKRNVPAYIVGAIISIGMALLAIWLRGSLPEWLRAISPFVSTALIISAAILWAVNKLISELTLKPLKETDMSKRQDFILENRDNALNDYKKELVKVRNIRRLYIAYAVWLITVGIITPFFGGAGDVSPGNTTFFALVSALLFAAAVIALPKKRSSKELDGDANYVSESDYPYLYSLAKRAASEAGCEKKIKICFVFEGNAGIADYGGTVSLLIGSTLLGLLSESELYSVLLHEFSHYAKGSFEDYHREEQMANHLRGLDGSFTHLDRLFLPLGKAFIFRYMLFQSGFTLTLEADADRTAIERSSPEVFASALLKISFIAKDSWESGSYDCNDSDYMYSSDEMPSDYPAYKLRQLKSRIEKRAEIWTGFTNKEIIARNATHPTLKMRLEAAGVSDIVVRHYDSSREYKAESEKAIAFAGLRFKEMASSEFEKTKKEYYTEPSEKIAEWEKAGMPLDPEEYGDIVEYLRLLDRVTDAEALIDRAINELPAAASVKAVYYKGCLLLRRYDDAGIELIYRAMDGNHNYVEEGISMLGEYCCMTGNEKELERYREKALEFAQKDYDIYDKLFNLSKDDVLTAETLPEGMLERDIERITTLGNGDIEKIYLVKKTVMDESASIYIIKFVENTDGDKKSDILHSIFMYLDTVSDWQYSLYDYEDTLMLHIDKINGALVWKSENK